MRRYVYAVATMDTKGDELAFVAGVLRRRGVAVRMIDVGTLSSPTVPPDVTRDEVMAALPIATGNSTATATDRGEAIARRADGLQAYLGRETAAGRVLGVIGLGGSGGTALISPALRALPIGVPKILVSTVASGNVAPYVDCSDIMMMYSVVDVAGLNSVSTTILANAASAMAGMVQRDEAPIGEAPAKRRTVGMTMFGVTTPCVTRVRQALEAAGWDCLVFHATGTGGRAMEQLVDSGFIGAVLDITTTEIADELVGGIFPSGPHRFDKLLDRRVPLVLSLGALDMVNFGAKETVPAQLSGRQLHCHNAQVTLMRTSAEECRQIGRWIADKLNRSTSPLRVLIPEGGLSLLDVPDQPFHDPVADAALFDSLEQHLDQNAERQIVRLPWDINAPEFADALIEHHQQLTSTQ
ncbi:Tm-1-like ATP-binding domain-containing protein [Stieleria mannarensis]|uniref:Tm-1-like ATP-binding domain-containing protein n=1 Tax=Stieleria mannarensis TaxID=2755585 RepID=UPI0016006D3C|nr:Tm-1-like ATP-binding domain-containing protein [Rhodopirellula sp. JC639]